MKQAAAVLLLLLALIRVSAVESTAAASAPAIAAEKAAPDAVVAAIATPTHKRVVYVIPVRDEIAKPVLYILRRGLKEAIDQKADAVVLDMSTPGGELGVTFDIMEALGKFPGETLTFVNKEAMSAGAFISGTTQEIWFTPDGVIGAAAPVSSGGQDIDATMKQKVVSYLKARVRAMSEGHGYRGEVISAMIDADYELKIGDKVIKPKGELLSLTASEANKTYGEPPRALLGAGIAKDIDALLAKKYGEGNFVVKQFEVTWSERLAQYLTAISPILLGLGLLALFIEFKVPGHGWIGGIGIVLLALVFFGHYVAGLSGHEPVLVFALGLLMLAVEVFFLPGVFVLAASGILLMLGSLLWSMADLWPNEPLSVSGDAFIQPLGSLGLGMAIAIIGGALLLRFLPDRWFWDKMAIGAVVGGSAQVAGVAPSASDELASLAGRRGVAVTVLRPSGHVEIDGRRFEARAAMGGIDAGAKIVVQGRDHFALIVEEERA